MPVAYFYYYPNDPSGVDSVQFNDASQDSGQVGIQSQAWDFGDGATATGCCPRHGFAADGDYTVKLTVTTYDGRSASTSRVLTVKTHDVGITKFMVPQSGSAGQTRQISVGINNSRYPETVRVELYRSSPTYYQSFQQIGYLEQSVPVRSSNRTTDFAFSYTFSLEDAHIGKVTFRAYASILNGRDVFQGDNEAISLPTKVSGSNTVLQDGTPNVDAEVLPERLALLGFAPNGAGPDLRIRLSLPTGEAAALQVLDIAGRVLARQDVSSLGRGVHETQVTWDRRPAPGIYWVRLTQGGEYASTKVAILQ
jgi:PKD repeat protein